MNYRTDGDFHTDLIELLARRMRPSLYVELGLGPEATTIRRVAPHCGRAVGVDTAAPRAEFCRGFDFRLSSSVDFLNCELSTIGLAELAFIDADHSAAATLDDFFLLLPHMAIGGVVLMHDTYPENASYTDPGRCGDCWRTAEHLSQHAGRYGIEAVTLPTPPGLTIIRKVNGQHLHWQL